MAGDYAVHASGCFLSALQMNGLANICNVELSLLYMLMRRGGLEARTISDDCNLYCFRMVSQYGLARPLDPHRLQAHNRVGRGSIPSLR